MIKPMLTSERIYATTELEAEGIVRELKTQHGESVKKHSITKRTKITKEEIIEFYIVDFTIEHDTIKGIIGL